LQWVVWDDESTLTGRPVALDAANRLKWAHPLSRRQFEHDRTEVLIADADCRALPVEAACAFLMRLCEIPSLSAVVPRGEGLHRS
jgi:hypothetical protein